MDKQTDEFFPRCENSPCCENNCCEWGDIGAIVGPASGAQICWSQQNTRCSPHAGVGQISISHRQTTYKIEKSGRNCRISWIRTRLSISDNKNPQMPPGHLHWLPCCSETSRRGFAHPTPKALQEWGAHTPRFCRPLKFFPMRPMPALIRPGFLCAGGSPHPELVATPISIILRFIVLGSRRDVKVWEPISIPGLVDGLDPIPFLSRCATWGLVAGAH